MAARLSQAKAPSTILAIAKDSARFRHDALSEIQAFMKKTGRIIRPITVKDIFDEQVARKLA